MAGEDSLVSEFLDDHGLAHAIGADEDHVGGRFHPVEAEEILQNTIPYTFCPLYIFNQSSQGPCL